MPADDAPDETGDRPGRPLLAVVRSSPYLPVLQVRFLRRVLAGIGLSSVGDGLSAIAIGWLALEIAPADRAATWVAVATAAYTLPGAVGAFVFARWLSGRAGAQLAVRDASLRAAFLITVPLLAATGGLSIGLLVVLLAGSSLLGAWGRSGRYVLLADAVPAEHQLAGNALVNIVLELAYVAGPPLAALLLTVVDPSVVIGLDAVTFAVLALVLRFAVPARLRARPAGTVPSRAAGFGAIGADRTLGVLVAVSFVFFLCFGPVAVALTVYVRQDLGADAGTLAGYLTAFGIGGFVGAAVAGHLRRWSLLRTSLLSVLGVGVLLVPLGVGVPPVWGWVSFGAAGLFWEPFPATTTAAFQRSTPRADLAAVLAARTALQTFAQPAGALLAAPLIAGIGARCTLLVCGFAIIATAVLGALVVATGRLTAGPRDSGA
ncbi:MAG TPA: MFS transporter [Cellulomonas sp.]